MILGKFYYITRSIKYRLSLFLELLMVLFIASYRSLSIIASIPETVNAFVGTTFIILVPVLLGHCLMTFRMKPPPSSSSKISLVSDLSIFWAIGDLFSLILVLFCWATGIKSFYVVVGVILILILLNSFNTTVFLKNCELGKVRSKSKVVIIITFVLVIGLSPVLYFRSYQPFPTSLSSEFSYFGRAVQLMDSSEKYEVVERAAYQIFSIPLSYSSYLSNSHPLAIIWASAFPQSIIIAAGIFLLAKSLFGSTIPSLISAFLLMWVFGIGSTHNNPYVVSNGTIQYAFFVLALYIVTRDLQSGTATVQRLSWPVILGIPALVVVQRIVIGYESELFTFLVLFLPFIFLLCSRKKLLTNSKSSFSTKLLLLLTFISVTHPYMAPLYVFDILAYIWLWKYLLVYKKTRIFVPAVIILGTSIFYLIQASGLVTIRDNFVLSRFLFGNTYEGAQGIDVGFSKKIQMFNNGNGPIVISFFVAGVALMLFNSFKKKLVSDIAVVTVSILTFFIYFFPESWFVRARHMIPFFVLVIGGGANVMISYLHKFLERMTHARIHTALRTKLSVLMVTLIFLPVLYCSTTAFQNHLAPSIASNKLFVTFETYEFEAGKWLHESVPLNKHDKTLILSDPYTINLMTSLNGLTAPYQKAWISEEEYSKEDLQTMAEIKDVFFKSANSTDRWAFLTMLLNKTNTSSAIVIINGRTAHWLRVNSVFVSSSFGIPFSIDLKYVENFSLIFETRPIYSVNDKLYIYNMSRS